MKIEQARNEIKNIEASFGERKIDKLFCKNASKRRLWLAGLRFCGIQESDTDFECNYCGETHSIGEANAAWRRGVPVVVCHDCLNADGVEEL